MQINLTPDPSLLVIMAIFLANYWIVRKFFIQPVNAVITARDGEIRGADKLYEEALARFNEATADVESRLHQARREATGVREALRNEAAQHRAEVVARTRARAEGVVEEADRELRSEVVAARESVQRDSEALARLAAEKILGRPL